MPGPLPIHSEHSAAELRRLARHERDGRVSTRLLALANALEGMPRERAAQLAGMTGQTLGARRWLRPSAPSGMEPALCRAGWVHRYNEEGLAGLEDRRRSGRPCGLDEGRQATLKALILKGPKLERDGCVAWRVRDLCRLVERRFGVTYSENGMLSLIKRLELSWQKARPIHPEADLKAQARFKRAAPADPGDCRRPPRSQADRAVVRG